MTHCRNSGCVELPSPPHPAATAQVIPDGRVQEAFPRNGRLIEREGTIQRGAGSFVRHAPPLRAIFAQASRSETVRLKISAPGRESVSTQKYPSRSNW